MDITITTETSLINNILENVAEWLKIKVYIVNHKRNVHDKQSLDDHYFKFFILRSVVITIQKVRGTVSGFVQVQRGRRDKTVLHRQKRLLSFQNDRFCIS